jgi:pimeloyl-ACP methyl ester carboxylesterase
MRYPTLATPRQAVYPSQVVMIAPVSRQSYTWKTYPCAYEHYPARDLDRSAPLLLIHPLGVGLAGWFWHRFCQEARAQGWPQAIYNPDLLGCGHSDKPRVAYYPQDWADQLVHFIHRVIQKPVVLLVQGGSLALGLKLIAHPQAQGWVQSLVLSGPPGWTLMTSPTPRRRQKLLWNLLLGGPVGAGFFRYARREAFLQSFSRRQLFAQEADIDREWLDQLQQDARDTAGRYAVYSFLAGFWREDYTPMLTSIPVPTLVLFGEAASGINQLSRRDAASKRLEDYLHHLPQATGKIIPGRNVLPYESTHEFVTAMGDWINCDT